MSDQEKRYADREFALIIQAALELERKNPNSAKDGLLLSEIETIAQETGISVEHVRSAVDQIVEAKKKGQAHFWLGSATSFESRDLAPETLNPEQLEQLRQALPSLTTLSESNLAPDGSIQWKRGVLGSMLDGYPLTLQVKNRDRKTEIVARADLRSTAVGLFLISGGAGVVLGLKLALFAMLVIGLGNVTIPTGLLLLSAGGLIGMGGFWFVARWTFRWFAKRARGKVAELVSRIRSAIPSIGKRSLLQNLRNE